MVTVFDLYIPYMILNSLFNYNYCWTCAISWHFLETCKDSSLFFIFNLFLTLIATFTFIDRINILCVLYSA
jgi:hypothetical protein